jgi:hypothetical protein
VNLIPILREAGAGLACFVLLVELVGGTAGHRALRRWWYGWALGLSASAILLTAWLR